MSGNGNDSVSNKGATGDGAAAQSASGSERQQLELLLESVELSGILGSEAVPPLDAHVPLAGLVCTLAESDERIDPRSAAPEMQHLWRAARSHGMPISTAVSHAVSDEVRAKVFGVLMDRWHRVPAADRRGSALVLLHGLPDPNTPALFLGAVHPQLMRVAADAAVEREHRLSWSCVDETEDAGLPDSADSPEACERLVHALADTDIGQAYQIASRLAGGGNDAVAWLTYECERDYRISRAMIHRLRALVRLDVARAVRVAGGLFRSDEHRGSVTEEEVPLYVELLELLLECDAPEIYPLLVFVFEPGGQMAVPREHVGKLRDRIRESSHFRRVRKLLRRLQRGEPVLVPAGVEFERFVNSELQRLGYSSDSPDPQVIAAIRKRWRESMHEDLLYLRPEDVPEVSFDDILGTPRAGESVGGYVEQQSSDDAEWILRPAAEGRPPRIVAAYRHQGSVYEAAGFERLHKHQLRATVRDLVMRGARALVDGEEGRAALYAAAVTSLDSEDPYGRALAQRVDNSGEPV